MLFTCSSSVPLLNPPTEAELRLRAPRELPAPDDPPPAPLLLNAGSGGESERRLLHGNDKVVSMVLSVNDVKMTVLSIYTN